MGGRPDADAPPGRPRAGAALDVPILVGALGPKGDAVARELGDGVYVTLQCPEFMGEYPWVALPGWGTVLDERRAPAPTRARAAAGPGWALAYHGAYEFGGPDAVRGLPEATSGWTSSSEPPPTSGISPSTPDTASS